MRAGKQTCVVMSDPQYAAAIAGNNPGINAPAAGATLGRAVARDGGAITCGGAVCGSATYQEESMQDTTGDLVAIGQLGASLPALVRGGASLGQSLARGIAGLFSKEAGAVAKIRFKTSCKAPFAKVVQGLKFFRSQAGLLKLQKTLESLEGSAQTVGPVWIKDLPNGQGRAVLRNFSSDGSPRWKYSQRAVVTRAAIRYNP